MGNLEEKLERYSKNISLREVSDAFKVYYETRDLRIREQLIYRYMPIAKKIILSFGITSAEEEDLEQMSYERLICSIDRYNPYWSTPFSVYLHSKMNQLCKFNNNEDEQEIISMSDVDIYSNDNLEDNIIEKEVTQEIIVKLKKLFEEYPNYRAKVIFKKIYGMDYEKTTTRQLAKRENISQTALLQKKNRILLYLFLNLPESYQYYPSKIIENMIESSKQSWLLLLSKETKKKIENLNLNNMDHFIFYHSYDSLEDSHKVLKRK